MTQILLNKGEEKDRHSCLAISAADRAFCSVPRWRLDRERLLGSGDLLSHLLFLTKMVL